MPAPVNTKTDFIDRFQKGEFGNRSPVWSTLNEFRISENYRKLDNVFSLRSRHPSSETFYNLTREQIEYYYTEEYYISEMVPSSYMTIQGEVIYSQRGMRGYLSKVKKPMKPSLLEGGYEIFGISLITILKYHMDVNSYEWFQYLLKAYPDHVIEFSCFNRYFGDIPRRNTIFWEVRNY